jgi:hypothetical protein
VEALNASVLHAHQAFAAVSEFFGETSVENTTEAFFGTLATFVAQVEVRRGPACLTPVLTRWMQRCSAR